MQAKGETAAQTQQLTQKGDVPMQVNFPSPTGANKSPETVTITASLCLWFSCFMTRKINNCPLTKEEKLKAYLNLLCNYIPPGMELLLLNKMLF